ncbi:RNA polymerase sigma factor [Sphingobacterium paludis]|jgi:RNA polymerase sigma factor (sigma-70 family)|uniref:RNA polymerase sigma-70 factor (ECF subfamily) n=1 Tax=Sphingobacterium paludis TaxID=1476465 RepID=A0A4R7CSR9_9SPHI|nr:sigma-70 family RNA polymerase sigma factor [Sphingobacterium paludis]TDS11061.1 RNA polymerase sigma-70 factor (ECF subfamily) [Sphingobacterium paludis]
MKRYTSSERTMSDGDLLSSYKATGELATWGELYSRHSEMVYYVCLRYFKDAERSKDAVMQLFEELIHKVNKQDIKDFPKWLYVVSKNHCLMALRSSKQQFTIPVDDFVEFSVNLHQEENYAEKEERLSLLESCIEKLPVKQKITVDLFFLQEKCYKEVAELSGYNVKEVKSFIQNGKRNLKICMESNAE